MAGPGAAEGNGRSVEESLDGQQAGCIMRAPMARRMLARPPAEGADKEALDGPKQYRHN